VAQGRVRLLCFDADRARQMAESFDLKAQG